MAWRAPSQGIPAKDLQGDGIEADAECLQEGFRAHRNP